MYLDPVRWLLFAGTLRRVYDGDVIIFVRRTNGWVERFARQQRIFLRRLDRVEHDLERRNIERFLHYAAACSSYSWCLAIDFRDSYFQRHPFTSAPGGIERVAAGAEVILQQELGSPIAGNPYNIGWLTHCFGDKFARRVSANQPVCGGSMFITPKGMRSFMKGFCSSLWRRVDGQDRACIDQGILNALAYGSRTPRDDGVRWLVQQSGSPRSSQLVNHVGNIWPADVLEAMPSTYRDSEGFVLEGDGNRSAVVHQYDRYKKLRKFACWLSVQLYLGTTRRPPLLTSSALTELRQIRERVGDPCVWADAAAARVL